MSILIYLSLSGVCVHISCEYYVSVSSLPQIGSTDSYSTVLCGQLPSSHSSSSPCKPTAGVELMQPAPLPHLL